MLTVYLTDLNQWVKVDFGQGQHDLGFIMRLKKIFLSTSELLEPVIPEDEDLSQITWRTTHSQLATLQKLAHNWQQLEVRLRAYAAFAGKEAMSMIVQVAHLQRREQQEQSADDGMLVALDVMMLKSIHQQLDALLLREPAYLPLFLHDWPEFKQTVH